MVQPTTKRLVTEAALAVDLETKANVADVYDKTASDGRYETLTGAFSGDAADLTGGPVPLAILASGTPAAGKYPDGAGGWTTLPASSSESFNALLLIGA